VLIFFAAMCFGLY